MVCRSRRFPWNGRLGGRRLTAPGSSYGVGVRPHALIPAIHTTSARSCHTVAFERRNKLLVFIEAIHIRTSGIPGAEQTAD
jgi:hypothetical protein